jgi:hypothetical protein
MYVKLLTCVSIEILTQMEKYRYLTMNVKVLDFIHLATLAYFIGGGVGELASPPYI